MSLVLDYATFMGSAPCMHISGTDAYFIRGLWQEGIVRWSIALVTVVHRTDCTLLPYASVNVKNNDSITYLQFSNISLTQSHNINVSGLILQLSLPNPLKPGISWEWRCSWSSADRRCSNYIWVINNFIAYLVFYSSSTLLWSHHQSVWMAIHTRLCDSLLRINLSPPKAAYMHQWTGSALVQIMACRLIGAKPLSKLILGYCQFDP